MAKKKSKNSQQSESDSGGGGGGKSSSTDSAVDSVPESKEDSGGGDDVLLGEEEMELLQVDLGDMVKMKQVLDEGVSSALLDHVPEDYRWDNFKLVLMFVSCLFAMTAQFAPIPFPQSRPVLGICGSLYFIFSGILQFITTFIDKDMIMQSKPLLKVDEGVTKNNSNNNNNNTNPLLYQYGLRVRSNFPRFSEFYTVILEFRIPANDPLHSTIADKSVKAVWSVGKFFDKEGYFDEIGLSHEITKLFKRLEAQDYNGNETAKPLTEKKVQ